MSAEGLPYFLRIPAGQFGPSVEHEPVCLYLEVTNRCNLLCETCPRTFASVERPADLTLEQVKLLVDQIEHLEQVVLHGIGEPMMNKALPEMIAYIKQRPIKVVFNTNGTYLDRAWRRILIETGLDECRVSLDAADAKTYELVRGLPQFDRIVKNVQSFARLLKRARAERPKLSLWMTGLKETIGQLPRLVELAARIGVGEVYLQRLVYFDDQQGGHGLATPSQSLFDRLEAEESECLNRAEELAREHGIRLCASGTTNPERSLEYARLDGQPWTHCRRPWSLMYVTANGNVLPCCISPFVERDYDQIILGNAFEKPLMEIWNGEHYRNFRSALGSDRPPHACQGCGLRWSL